MRTTIKYCLYSKCDQIYLLHELAHNTCSLSIYTMLIIFAMKTHALYLNTNSTHKISIFNLNTVRLYILPNKQLIMTYDYTEEYAPFFAKRLQHQT